ncbi:uncharacterized protein LOC132788949 [Drosophila nasuta]|uniref:uncharacterized protein LOC132788949 n=1 Tax=Drosophila nasuta TaxID=42062 RepID=UPI00295F445C|nr:uncharacterized protein LOC132788949 [Drosophila nasuta]
MSSSQRIMNVDDANRFNALYISPVLQRMIKDLLVPHITMLEKMENATELTMIQRTVPRPSSDWWPIYSFKTYACDKVDIRGVLVLTHNYIKSMPPELKMLNDTFKVFADNQISRYNLAENDIETCNAYHLANKMFSDMYVFVVYYINHLQRLQENRRKKLMKACRPNKIKARIELLIYDQYIYSEHQKALRRLKRVTQNACSLFGLAEKLFIE